MHPPSRTRRIVKWTGVGLSLVIMATWAASLFCTATVVPSPNTAIFFYPGGVVVARATKQVAESFSDESPPVPGFRMHGVERRGVWPPFWLRAAIDRSQTNILTLIYLPYWPLFLITAIPTAWLWQRDRRRIRPGCCLRCGYDLTGNTSGVCSECGNKIRNATGETAT